MVELSEMDRVPSFRRRIVSIPLRWLAVPFVAAQLADLATALVVREELNPLVAALGGQPIVGAAVKVGLVVFVVWVARICDSQRPVLARLILVIGIVAGLFGALSNTHLTPFISV